MATTKKKEITAKIVELKKKHSIKEVIVLRAGDAVGYIKKPTRHIIGNALPLASTNPVAYAESILENCWLEGDECIKEEDDYFMGVFEKLQEITQSKIIEVEKH